MGKVAAVDLTDVDAAGRSAGDDAHRGRNGSGHVKAAQEVIGRARWNDAQNYILAENGLHDRADRTVAAERDDQAGSSGSCVANALDDGGPAEIEAHIRHVDAGGAEAGQRPE